MAKQAVVIPAQPSQENKKTRIEHELYAVERIGILLYTICWICDPTAEHSNLEAFLLTAFFGVINLVYYIVACTGAERIRHQQRIFEQDDKSEEGAATPFDRCWAKVFWAERYALLQLLLVWWLPIPGVKPSAALVVPAFILFVILPTAFP